MIKETGHFKHRVEFIGGHVEKGSYEASVEKLTRTQSKDILPSLSPGRRRLLKRGRGASSPRKFR